MAAQAHTSLLDHVKNWLSEAATKLDFSGPNLMQTLIYASAGFFIGFFLSKYFRSFLTGMVLCVIILGALHYLQIITFDLQQLRSVLGVGANATLEQYATQSLEWAKTHPLFAGSSVLGFIIGYKAA